jgi:hypothetical protein
MSYFVTSTWLPILGATTTADDPPPFKINTMRELPRAFFTTTAIDHIELIIEGSRHELVG